jgi:hypothetical protein
MATIKTLRVLGRPAKHDTESGTWEATYWFGDKPVVHTIDCATLPEFVEKVKAVFNAEPLDEAFNGWSLTIKPTNGRWAPGFKRLADGLWLRSKSPVAA